MSAPSRVVGDVGGTHTRLACARGGQVGRVRRYLNAEADTLEACIAAFIEEEGLRADGHDLVLAVAGPVDAGEVELTNLAWRVSAAALVERFGFDAAHLVNDFEALAHAIPAFGAADTIDLGGGPLRRGQPAVIMGPGTGFGAGLWLPGQGALATEAGHALIAPVTEAEAAVVERLRAAGTPPSVEDLVSGPGLVRLYEQCAGAAHAAVTTPEGVVQQALHEGASPAREALALFFAFLGLAARNLALSSGALGGVYLAGGILPRYADELSRSAFRARFETPAPLPGYLERIATRLVVHPEPALLGLATL